MQLLYICNSPLLCATLSGLEIVLLIVMLIAKKTQFQLSQD